MLLPNPLLSFPLSPKPTILRSTRNNSLRISASSVAPLESLESVLSATSVLAAIVLVHESGHFLAASLRGIRVSKFSLGFGPVLARFPLPSSPAVEFSLRALPLGGFVAFPDVSDPDFPDLAIAPDDPDLLRNRPLPDRFLVVSAGIAANLIFAYSLLFVQVVSVGIPVQSPLPGILVPDVKPNSPAAAAGLIAGDVILSSPSVTDLVDLIKNNPSTNLTLQIKRQSENITIVPDTSPDGTGRIGVQLSPNYAIKKLRARNLPEAVSFSWKEFSGLSGTVFDGLRQTVMNFSQSASKVSGPVAIIAVGAEVARSGSDGLFQFAAVININLAAINLLPLPALDGGTLALLLVEAVRGGRKIPREIEQRIMSSGVLVVLMLGVFLIVRDTLNLDFIREML